MVRQRDLIRAQLTCDKKRALCDDIDCNICFNKSFASSIPKTIKFVDKNIEPIQIQKYSQKKYLFHCTVCKHEFYKKIKSITKGEHCIYCTAKPIKICGEEDCKFCYEKSFASHEKASCWDYKKNKVNPLEVYKKSTDKYCLKCDKCNHSFDTTPKRICDGHFCPYCANLKMCGKSECIGCLSKSFIFHPMAENWNFAKNEVSPCEVFRSSDSKKYYFNCKKCNHELYLQLASLDENTSNCEYCSGKKLCKVKKCIHCYNKSFASNSFAKYWSPKNKESPREVTNKTSKKYLFDCRECKHEIEIPPSRIQENKLNCIYCASLKMCNNKDCNFCFNKSFATHEKSKYWSDKNKVKPRDVFKCTDYKYIFNCNFCKGEFSSSLSSITRGSWCNLCVNKTEKMLNDWLIDKYGEENIKKQFVMFNKKNKYFFDFYLPNFNLIIELDGLQHFKQVGKWKSPEHSLENDINKINLSIENNLSMVRILQEDVYYNRNDWETKLSNCIKKYDIPTCIFIDNDNIYEKHITSVNDNVNIVSL